MNLNIKFSKDLFKRKKRAPASTALVPQASSVWRFSILFLILFMIGVLFFDGYIFFFKVQELERESQDVYGEVGVEGLNKQAFDAARKTLQAREGLFENASSSVPARNPFE